MSDKLPRPLTISQLREAHELASDIPPDLRRLKDLDNEKYGVYYLDITTLSDERRTASATEERAWEPSFLHASLDTQELDELRTFLKAHLLAWCRNKVEQRKCELRNFGVEVPDDW